MPTTFDITQPPVYRGDTYVMEITFWANAAKTTPYPINGALSYKAEIRHHTGSPVLGTFQAVLLTSNSVRLTLTSATTKALPINRNPLQWDFQVTWDNAVPPAINTMVKGLVVVEGDITDSA